MTDKPGDIFRNTAKKLRVAAGYEEEKIKIRDEEGVAREGEKVEEGEEE